MKSNCGQARDTGMSMLRATGGKRHGVFVITVGSADPNGSPDPHKATIAPWSAWGYTVDGLAKPELSAPGRYMIGPVPDDSTLVGQHLCNVTSPGYIELSGTSFAAPVVSGAAANILAQHPDWTPDQVKGAPMATAQTLAGGVGAAGGVGLVQAADAVNSNNTPNPNLPLEQFVRSSNAGGSSGDSFDSASWNSTTAGNASWNSASWNSSSRGDAAEDDTAPTSPLTLSASQVAALMAGLAP